MVALSGGPALPISFDPAREDDEKYECRLKAHRAPPTTSAQPAAAVAMAAALVSAWLAALSLAVLAVLPHGPARRHALRACCAPQAAVAAGGVCCQAGGGHGGPGR